MPSSNSERLVRACDVPATSIYCDLPGDQDPDLMNEEYLDDDIDFQSDVE